jgi:hypothetical protein
MQVEGLRVVSMADVKRGSDKRWDFASLPQGEGTVVASDVLRAMDVQTAIDAAVKEGKITPAQRDFYEKSALADLDGFKSLVASMRPVVDFKERGTGADGAKLDTAAKADAEFVRLVREKQQATNKGYGEAMRLVASENPELVRRRELLRRREGGR